ncbi:hypothetical protein DENSPDRAFT_887217 [Dentipellis sp. KUC8613]|nr:hypothetical protein DENSPDRAFT_887217 [Dentipellis sp. KUC8613]
MSNSPVDRKSPAVPEDFEPSETAGAEHADEGHGQDLPANTSEADANQGFPTSAGDPDYHPQVPADERIYVVTRGARTGIFVGWNNTAPHVMGVSNAIFQRFRSMEQARAVYSAWEAQSLADNLAGMNLGGAADTSGQTPASSAANSGCSTPSSGIASPRTQDSRAGTNRRAAPSAGKAEPSKTSNAPRGQDGSNTGAGGGVSSLPPARTPTFGTQPGVSQGAGPGRAPPAVAIAIEVYADGSSVGGRAPANYGQGPSKAPVTSNIPPGCGGMPPATGNGKYYVVARGLRPGIYGSWAEAAPLVLSYFGARYKSFRSYAEALAWFHANA